MSFVRPFAGLLPDPELAQAVASPPLGELTTREWFGLSQDNPLSFLHVIRTEIDSEGGGPDPAMPQTSGRPRLDEMIAEGVLQRSPAPAYYVYRTEDGTHTSTGLIAEVHVAGYADGRIRRHEETREATEELLVAHMRRLSAHSDPVGLTHRDDPELASIVAGIITRTPYVEFAAHGLRQSVWVVDDAASLDALQARLDGLRTLYITDGHHRCAAALRYAEERSMADPVHEGSEEYHYLLAALYPESELRLLAFHRCVGNLGMTSDEIVAKVGAAVELESAAAPAPMRRGEVVLRAGGNDYRFDLPPGIAGDVHDNLDVVRLQEVVLGPALGITRPRVDSRLNYVAASAAVVPEDHHCDACFLMYPTSVADVMRIADSGKVMPPKSTWFEPKVWGGLFVALLDDD